MVRQEEAPKRDRAYVDGSQIEAYRALAGAGESAKASSGEQMAPFKSLKDVFLLAACLGARAGRRTKLKNRKELVLTSYLNHQDFAFLRALAIKETKEVETLGSLNEVLTISEEFASTGFDELKRAVQRPGIPLENLADLVFDELPSSS